jgi:hypothetical protein
MSKHDKVLAKIYEKPVRADITWRECEALLLHLGAKVTEGRGSRVRVLLNGIRSSFHRPHPQKEMDKGAIVSLIILLSQAGIEP